MTIAELQQELNRRGVILSLENGRLKVDAPTGTLTPELKEELTREKDVLLFELAVAGPSPDLESPDALYLACPQASYPVTLEWPDGSRTTYNTSEEAYNDLWFRQMLKEVLTLGAGSIQIVRMSESEQPGQRIA